MRVHVIRANDFSEERYEQIMQELRSVGGLISFERQAKLIEPETLHEAGKGSNSLKLEEDSLGGIYERKIKESKPWSYFFKQCDAYRGELKIEENDFVVLLSPKQNNQFHFAAFEDGSLNVFIHTEDWDEYIFCSPIFPISYLVMSQVLQKLCYKRMRTKTEFAHIENTHGCINDYCLKKSQITLKLRTADICEPCIKFMLEAGVGEEYLIQAFALFERLRNEMLFKQRHRFKLAQRAIHVTRSTGRGNGICIQVPELKKEISLNPKEAALYLFYLKSTKGASYSSLENPNNRKELLSLYSNLYEGNAEDRKEKAVETIDRLIKNKAIRDSDLSRMRSKFTKILGEEIGKDYYINGLQNDTDVNKGIRLSRELVTYDYTVKNHILN